MVGYEYRSNLYKGSLHLRRQRSTATHIHTPGSRGVGTPGVIWHRKVLPSGLALRERQHLAMTATCPEGEAWAASRNWNYGTHFLWDPRAAPTFHPLYATAHNAARSTSNLPQLCRLLPVDHPRVVTVWRHVADVLAFGLMDTRCFQVHLHRLVVRWHPLSSFRRCEPFVQRVGTTRALGSVSLYSSRRNSVWFQAC